MPGGAGGIGFLLKIPGGGGGCFQEGEEPGGCLWRIGEFGGGGGLNIFFGAETSTKNCKQPGLKTRLATPRWTFRIFCIFFLLGGGEGGVQGDRRGDGGFLLKIRGGGGGLDGRNRAIQIENR